MALTSRLPTSRAGLLAGKLSKPEIRICTFVWPAGLKIGLGRALCALPLQEMIKASAASVVARAKIRPGVSKRLNNARKEATGTKVSQLGTNGTDGALTSDNEESSSSSDDDDDGDDADSDQDVDERIEMEAFKDECWADLTSTSLIDDIAALTGEGSGKKEGGDNIVVGFRIRPARAIESVDEEPACVAKGVREQHSTFPAC